MLTLAVRHRVRIILTIFILAALLGMRPRLAQRQSGSGGLRCCGPGCRNREPAVVKHYNKRYFDWQTQLGREKAAQTNWTKFLGLRAGDVVADLGAGGGHILANLTTASRRIAIEVNPDARAGIRRMYPNVEAYAYPEDIPDGVSIDVLYSTSAIEHFECPLTELRELGRRVRPGGRVIIGVKNEGMVYATRIIPKDIHQHIWTWNRQLLHNLLNMAGFECTKVDPPAAEMLDRANVWSSKENVASGKEVIYHWAYGVKRL